ncbi:MAG: hypothetical protein WAT67_12345 [Candidatus Contendobacter sp.]
MSWLLLLSDFTAASAIQSADSSTLEKNPPKNSRNALLSVLFLLFIVAPLALALAEENPKQRDVDEQVTTPTRMQKRLIDVPVAVQVITQEKIELSGANQAEEIIGKYVTGL